MLFKYIIHKDICYPNATGSDPVAMVSGEDFLLKHSGQYNRIKASPLNGWINAAARSSGVFCLAVVSAMCYACLKWKLQSQHCDNDLGTHESTKREPAFEKIE